MRTITENTVAKAVTRSPEELEDIQRRLVMYRSVIALIKPLHDIGKLSDSTYRKMLKKLGEDFGFTDGSILSEIA